MPYCGPFFLGELDMRRFRRKQENDDSEWEMQSLLRYLQRLDSKPSSVEQETKRIYDLLGDSLVSETYKQYLREHVEQKMENQILELFQFR